MASVVNLADEARKMERIIQESCDKGIRLSYVDTKEAGYFIIANHKGHEECAKIAIFSNLNSIHPVARFLLVEVANKL